MSQLTQTVTVFCVHSSQTDCPTYITSFDMPYGAPTEEIAAAAVRDCAEAWGADEEDVVCIGIAEGDVKIIDWVDASDGGLPTK